MDLKRLAMLRKALPLAVLAAGFAFPSPGRAAPPEIAAPSLVSPGLGCGASPSSTALLGRVAVQRQRQHPPRRHRRHQAEAAPAAEPAAGLAHAFYTCAAMPLTAMPVGTGWLAVGPVRRS
ncbi:hypothetical protein JMJ56_03065 [Belnapia sp. T18]|uniref:Uncharacterized protein n=1 Tax=Belnapia arida TaxID=2804533 RepID=A0ABS1TX03_9PROT|nr:hypothetical protein [Belnapia arida]MBL6076970.1 hypothetical protein [Belnapia arida]